MSICVVTHRIGNVFLRQKVKIKKPRYICFQKRLDFKVWCRPVGSSCINMSVYGPPRNLHILLRSISPKQIKTLPSSDKLDFTTNIFSKILSKIYDEMKLILSQLLLDSKHECTCLNIKRICVTENSENIWRVQRFHSNKASEKLTKPIEWNRHS